MLPLIPRHTARLRRWWSFDEKVEERQWLAMLKMATGALGPPLLLAAAARLSPLAGLAAGGVTIAATVPCAPPGYAVPPPPPEEEKFMGLVFPGFDENAFIWKLTCFQMAEFVLTMALGHKQANPLPCVLYSLGASWGPAIARGEFWRLLLPVTLHANLSHLLFNVFFQLRIGFGMEKQFGTNKMMIIYAACGLIGNLISVAVDPFKLAVGASTAGFGLIGVWLAEIALSWEILGPAREKTMIWIVFMLISVTTMSSMTPNMDLYGHLGGALGGFLLAIILADMPENDRPSWYAEAKKAACVALLIVLGGCGTKVFAFSPRDPLPDCSLWSLPAAQGLAHAFSASRA